VQFDQDFGQLIGWLNEKSQQAILWVQSHDFKHGASLLKEAFEPARSWLHLIAVCFAFVSDVLKPLAPRFTKGLAIGGFTLSVPPFLGVESGFVPEGLAPLASTLSVFCLSVAVLSSVVLFLQRGHEHGALAELVPGVERLQERLGIIETKIDRVKEETEALRRGQEEEKARSEERHKEAIEGQKRLERLVMDVTAGGASAVQALRDIRELLRPEVPVIDETPDGKLPGLVKRILEDLQKPAARPEDFSGTVKRVLEEAQAQAAELKFADAAQVLDAALAETEAEDRDRARGRAALLAERGRIARLQLRYREAADFYARAAAEAVTFDPAAMWGYTLDTAGALYAQGDEFGDNPALSDAIRAFCSALDIATRARVPLDWAMTQTSLGVALSRLGGRESGTEKLEEAVLAYREALKEFTKEAAPYWHNFAQQNLDRTNTLLAQRRGSS
jgi:tetratricopeptide (TPR) repeat protein